MVRATYFQGNADSLVCFRNHSAGQSGQSCKVHGKCAHRKTVFQRKKGLQITQILDDKGPLIRASPIRFSVFLPPPHAGKINPDQGNSFRQKLRDQFAGKLRMMVSVSLGSVPFFSNETGVKQHKRFLSDPVQR